MARYNDPGHIPGAVFIPNCASVRLIWTLPNGKQANNVLHGRYSTAPARTQAYANSLFDAIVNAFINTNHNDAISSSVTLDAVGIRDMAQTTPPGGWTEIRSNRPASAGQDASHPLPANVSFVVSLKTDRRGQAARGRVYLPGFTEAANDEDGLCDNAVADRAVDFVEGVSAAMNSNGLVLCIAHPARAAYDSPVPPFTHHDARDATTVQVNSILKLNNVWDSTRLRAQR